ncbi:MAG: DUF6489 family protein [Pseudomonadota bacterium]
MKVTIEVDLSPAEAREIFGFPDFSDIHQQITDEMLKSYKQDPTKGFETFIKPAIESGMTGFSAYQKMFGDFIQGASAPNNK